MIAGKYPIDRPCSACSAGDTKMEYHDHHPPFRPGYGPSANERQVAGTHYGGATWQHWDWTVENSLGYLEGQVTKYISRWRRKNGREDLEKALHYADKLYEVEKANGCWIYNRFHIPEPVRGLERIIALYRLDPQEALVFRLAVEYRSLEDLNVMRGAIRNLIENLPPKET